MQIQEKQLKPVSSIQLTADEGKILKWIKSVTWEPQTGVREPIPYKAKVPEFFNGVKLFNMAQSGGTVATRNALDLFIKKLEYQGVITKQELYAVTTQGTARYIALKKADLDNLGVGTQDDDED